MYLFQDRICQKLIEFSYITAFIQADFDMTGSCPQFNFRCKVKQFAGVFLCSARIGHYYLQSLCIPEAFFIVEITSADMPYLVF